MTEHHEPGFWETLLADIEWSAGKVEHVDPSDPESWRSRGFDPKKLVSCLPRVGFHATWMYRVSRWCRQHGMPFLSYPIMVVNQTLTGAEISHNAKIGPGLRILHPMGIYVGGNVKIGPRSTFNQGTAVSKGLAEGSGEPEVGSYLLMSPGAKILGRVKVGDRVQVGPNSVVVRDVSDDGRVMGVPAEPLPDDAEMP
jgi:serine O-acetyltransferase